MPEESALGFETRCGILIAVFAALMAVTDVIAGKYGDDEIIGTNDKAAAYMWYQSKSIKETLVEGEKALLENLKNTGAIHASSLAGIERYMADLEKKTELYKKEKDEILRGSKAVGKDNWIQDVKGEMGRVIGAEEIEANLEVLSRAGDRFDVADLFFQLGLVLGAVSLILKRQKIQALFFYGMIVLGSSGTCISLWAFFSIVQS